MKNVINDVKKCVPTRSHTHQRTMSERGERSAAESHYENKSQESTHCAEHHCAHTRRSSSVENIKLQN
jgi:hypothetical protein